MPFAFKVGQHYRNRDGEYEVLSVTGGMMKIEYKDGRIIDSDIALQARILERMQEEEGLSADDIDVSDDEQRNSSRNTTEIREFVAEVLKGMRQPWTADVIDQVFLNIERRRDRLAYYEKLVKDFGEPTVNTGIGSYVRELTGLKSTSRTATAKSGLIKSYTVLVSR